MGEWEDLRLHGTGNPLLHKDRETKQRHQRPDIVNGKSLRAVHLRPCKKNKKNKTEYQQKCQALSQNKSSHLAKRLDLIRR